MKPQIHLVIWRDCTHFGESSISRQDAEDTTLIEMHTVGFLIENNAERIGLGMDYIPEQERWRHVTWIPKVNIVKRVRLFS